MTYGFIGLGNMASAILRGMARAGAFAENALVGYNLSAAKAQALLQAFFLRLREQRAAKPRWKPPVTP